MDRVVTVLSLVLFGGILLVGNNARTHSPPSWHDPSNHEVNSRPSKTLSGWKYLIGADKDARLCCWRDREIRHTCSTICAQVSGPYHVYRLTRRGFGASTHAESGYIDQRLADDILQVTTGP
jgi:hypothetical protein